MVDKEVTLFLMIALACTPKATESGETADTSSDSGTESGTDSDSGGDSESGETDSEDSDSEDSDSGGSDTSDTGEPMPADPRPLVLTVTGAYNGTLVFDEPTCSWYDGVPNFRAFWRNAATDHVFVLVAEILGPFDGEGTYDETMTTTRVKLQEEAGGSGYYFGTDTTQGDTAQITIEQIDETHAWGEFIFSGLHGEGGITVTPQPIPIWCPELM